MVADGAIKRHRKRYSSHAGCRGSHLPLLQLSIVGQGLQLGSTASLGRIHSPRSVLRIREELAHKGETQGSTDQPRSPALGLLCDADTGLLGQCRIELEKYGYSETVLCSTAIEQVLEQQNSAVEKAVG